MDARHRDTARRSDAHTLTSMHVYAVIPALDTRRLPAVRFAHRDSMRIAICGTRQAMTRRIIGGLPTLGWAHCTAGYAPFLRDSVEAKK